MAATKWPYRGTIQCRVVNRRHFEVRTRPEPEITNPALAQRLFFKHDVRPKVKFTE